MTNSDFFDYEKNLRNIFDSENKIEIYRSPNKRCLRKNSQDETTFQYDFVKGKINFNNNNNSEGGIRRFYSQKIKRNINSELLINDISHKDEMSTNRPLYSNKYINRTGSKSVKNLNRFRRKKVTFKNKLVNVIEIESYKKYNNNFYDNADAKCACIIF